LALGPVGPSLAVAATMAVATVLSATGSARAEAVDLRAYQPSPFGERLLRLDRTAVLPRGELRLGADIDYALRPLVLDDANPGIFQVGGPGPEHILISNAVTASLAASVGLGHHLELALALPVTMYQAGEAVPGVATPSLVGIGNARLGIKARLFARGGFGAGAAVLVSAPRGLGSFTAENGFGAEGRLFADYARGRFSVGARGGLRLRSETIFQDTPVGNELGFAAGAAVELGLRTVLMAELAGTTRLASPFGNQRQTPVEALGGIRRRIGKTWFTLAGGPGLTDGYGTPVFRIVAGVTWANRPPDADGDGIPDDDDRCRLVPEDKDGFEDTDGCPDPDNDKDGIPDATDKCPDQAEDKDGFEDADGCPDPDNDKDGIPDATDKCPLEPETVNGFEDEDGCPDVPPPAAAPVDTDKDGIVDEEDECPEEAEDKDGFEDEDGCPDPDNDKDGIPDATDKCPLEPETINGVNDDDGCPDEGTPEVRLGPHEIETLRPIFFATDRSRVRHAFYRMLGQVASLMKAHPEIGRVGIEGHTDATGPADWNQHLSMRRANAVVDFLVEQGIERARLVPIGQAEKLPWASNETPWGRAQNRRVVFHVEGVNPEAVKKDEARQERRRHIHRAHPKTPEKSKPEGSKPEASTHRGSTDEPVHEDGAPEGKARKGAPPERKPPEGQSPEGRSHEGQSGAGDSKDDARAPRGESRAVAPHADNTRAGRGEKDDARRAPQPTVKFEGATKESRQVVVSKTGVQSGAKTVPTTEDADAKEDGDVPATSVETATTDGDTPEKKVARRRWPMRPPRPPPKPMFTGPAPTLRELLVLPPK